MNLKEPKEGPVTNLQHLQADNTPTLHGHIKPFGATYAATQYLDLASDAEIERFLESSPLYDTEKEEWTDLVCLKYERDIRTRILQIVSTIVTVFGNHPVHGSVVREVCSTGYKGLRHVELDSALHTTSPAMVIRARGPSFEDPPTMQDDADAPELGYSNVASCLHILLEETLQRTDQFYAEQSAVFAK